MREWHGRGHNDVHRPDEEREWHGSGVEYGQCGGEYTHCEGKGCWVGNGSYGSCGSVVVVGMEIGRWS